MTLPVIELLREKVFPDGAGEARAADGDQKRRTIEPPLFSKEDEIAYVVKVMTVVADVDVDQDLCTEDSVETIVLRETKEQLQRLFKML